MDPDRYSGGSEQFRESTHLIPSVGTGKRRPAQYDNLLMSWPVVLGTPLLLLLLGVGLEIAVMISYKQGGFKVPQNNAIDIVSPQFLLAFFPTIIVAPFAFMWRELDWILRWLQPYIVLWRGRALAEESLLLDYVALGPFLALFRAMKYKHRLIFWSSLTATVTYLFQPLAGSIFQLRQQPRTEYGSVTSTQRIGLAPDVNQLNAFVAAAGFAEAAVFHHLPDPPFVKGGWATAEFIFPTDGGLNGTVTVNTTGIQSAVNCANPVESSLQRNADNSFSLTSKSVEGCNDTFTFDPRASTTQYGVHDVLCPGNAATTDVSFRPVIFWFFHNRTDSIPEAKTVFCAPSIKAFNVTASAWLSSKSIYNVKQLNESVPANNVTGPPLNGQAYNGVVFPDSNDTFIQARATATNSGVSGAIFRFASQQKDGPQSTFDRANGFLDITQTIYTQHLSLVASIYFVGTNGTSSAEMTSLIPVLWIDPLPGHALALILFMVGLIGIVVQVLYQRNRRKLLLAAPPGTIAAITSLTSRSGFGNLLLPYDDEKTLERKLSGLRFRLDRRTGAIVADDYKTEGAAMGPDDAMLSLLGQGHQRDTTSSLSSSHFAHQAAAGYPPWKTPYDP